MITYREALREGLHNVLKKHPQSLLIGEDVGAYGGAYAVSKGFLKEFGPDRIRDAPLSELGFTGLGIGAALGGLRPIIEIMTVNFSLLALDQIVNTAAFMSHMSGGQFNVPLIIRMTTGGGRQLAAQHSNSFEVIYAHIPGLKVFTPATIEDARYMIEEAMKETNPVLIFEQASLFNLKGELKDKAPDFSIEKTKVMKLGGQLSLISYGAMLVRCLEAAEIVLKDNIQIDVIDLRCLRPLDLKPVYNSILKTHRVLIVDESWLTGSLSGEISARITENCFFDLDRPVQRLCRKEVPLPYSKHLEDFAIPQVSDIVEKIRELVK